MRKNSLILATAGLFALSACTDPYANTGASNTQTGVAVGALAGGLLGMTRKGDNRLAKTAVGAVVGGAIGGAIGNQLDKQAAALRNDLGNDQIGIVNTGSELIVTMPQDILFATDSSTVSGGLYSDLAVLAGNLNQYPNSVVEVIGHTDNTGDAGYNQNLSARRAGAVASILISNGVSAGRVQSIGRGEDAPVATNLTPEGRAQNRRVEIVIRPNA